MKPAAGKATRVDWQQLHRRLRAAEMRMQQGATEAERERILRQRAAALAKKPAEEAPGQTLEVLEFTLANERYGLESAEVREVFPLREFTALPGAPPFMVGIVNLRGRLLPLVNLKSFFDLPERGLSDMNKVFVLEGQGVELGILGDTVGGLTRVLAATLQPALPTHTGVRQEFLVGIAPGRLALLDAQKIIADCKQRLEAKAGATADTEAQT